MKVALGSWTLTIVPATAAAVAAVAAALGACGAAMECTFALDGAGVRSPAKQTAPASAPPRAAQRPEPRAH